MKLITREHWAKSAPARFKAQYCDEVTGSWSIVHAFAEGTEAIYHKLLACDQSPETVVEILNSSWVVLQCDECGQYVNAIMELGDEPDYETATARLCIHCLHAAFKELQKELD
jgi:hypothetical protein